MSSGIPSFTRQQASRSFFNHNNNINLSIEINNRKMEMEVDVGDVAKKTLTSLALAVTNSILTITVGVTKLTGFAIIPSMAIGWITKPLHEANVALAKHAFTPFREWTNLLGKENKRIIETDKILEIKKQKLIFYPGAYIEQARDSLKIIAAPVSVALSTTIAAIWIAVKPLWLALWLPGLLADTFLIAPIALNKEVGSLTYAPLAKMTDKMFQFQMKFVQEMWEPMCRQT